MVKIEIINTGKYQYVNLVNGDRNITLRSYDNLHDARHFAFALSEVLGTDWTERKEK